MTFNNKKYNFNVLRLKQEEKEYLFAGKSLHQISKKEENYKNINN